MPAANKTVRVVVLVIASALMAVAAFFAGMQLSDDDSTSRAGSRGAFLVASAPALVIMVFIILFAFNVAWRPRIVGTHLVGTGVLGPVGVNLESLSRVRDMSARQGPYLALRDDQLSMTLSLKTLAQHRVLDEIASAVRRRQEQGQVTLTRGAAGILRLPPSSGTGARPAPTQVVVTLAVVVLFFAAFIVGLSAG
jgi:hypothetical protein